MTGVLIAAAATAMHASAPPWAAGVAAGLSAAALAAAAVFARRARRQQELWEQVACLATQDRPLVETAGAILDLLHRELPAKCWALYEFNERRQRFDLVSVQDRRRVPRVRLPSVALVPESDPKPESPASIAPELHLLRVGVTSEAGGPVLHVPLGAEREPRGVAEGSPFPTRRLTSHGVRLLESLRERLGDILAGAARREREREHLTRFQSSAVLEQALLESTFDAERLSEKTLGVLLASTDSVGASVFLPSVETGNIHARRVFHAGEGRSLAEADPVRWAQVEELLAIIPKLSRSAGAGDLLGPLAMDHLLACAINLDGAAPGLLVLSRRGERPFSASNARLARAFAEHLSTVLGNASAYHMAANTYRNSVELLVELMVELMDGRLPQTVGHSRRVMRWSLLIGRALGCSELELEAIRWSGLFHDVGMCGIAEEVLCTPGRLAEDEMQRIRQHPHVGAAICDPLRLPAPIAPGVLHHHERWDGRGYPEGLAGDEISLSGRIVAVAEVFNALVTARNYRAPQPFADAVSAIQEERGASFDPSIVDAFLQAVRGETTGDGEEAFDSPSGLPRCHEQKGAPAENCARCPAFMAPQPCWAVESVLCAQHGDRRCEECFVFSQAQWRTRLRGRELPMVTTAAA